MTTRDLTNLMAPDWAQALQSQAPTITDIGQKLRGELAAKRGYLPPGKDIFKAFTYPLADVKVLIVGQDPYPTPGDAMGLSFSVTPGTPIPRSLRNIFRELVDDLGVTPPTSGDLTPWCEQGVMLMNRVLTVQPGSPGSHRDFGWQQVTNAAVSALNERGKPFVAILWGRQAQELKPLLTNCPLIESVHPSPLSASRGFFGSKPFSTANAYLQQMGAQPVDWRLP
ncbi:uracil-DNA glycosylase [Actinomycetaceae bacterium TAE3-ERU4]|nr:uracil-DNA glycosylase [Actinomycetaceae bacterium TAE3-ERU4]